MVNDEIPYFIKIRGCSNCDSYKELKKRGKGFDHEIMVGCLLMNCFNYGFDLTNFFTDPEELIEFWKQKGAEPDKKENVREYCIKINYKFGNFYKRIDISIENLINSL
jgi:hypothetical protein